MISFSKEWPCVDAIEWLYFSSSLEVATTHTNLDIRQQILLALASGGSSGSKFAFGEDVRKVVASIRVVIPDAVHDFRLLGITWMRAAIRDFGLPIQPHILWRFFRWMAKAENVQLRLVKFYNPHKQFKYKVAELSAGESIKGRRVDQFIAWDYRGKVHERIVKVVTLDVLVRTPRRKSSSNGELRSKEESVGRQVLERIRTALEKESNRRRGKIVESRDPGRLASLVSRDEMIVHLKKRYPILKDYSSGNLKRALTEFVVFKRGRRKLADRMDR